MRGQVVAVGLGLLQPVEEGVHHLAVAVEREDQRDVDADALGQACGDRRQARLGGRDLDEQVGPVDQPPQRAGLGDGRPACSSTGREYVLLIILEPMGRNTAPAIAAAALQAMVGGGDPLLLVLPSDHVIRDAEAFRNAIAIAGDAAARGALVTFGIVPTSAETGLRLHPGRCRRCTRPAGVERFVEKPDRDTAERFLARRRLLLEQRHVPVPRAPLSRRARALPTRRCWRRRARHSTTAQRDRRLHPAGPRRLRRLPGATRSTTPSWRRTDGRRGRAGRHRLERRRLVVGAVGRRRSATRDGNVTHGDVIADRQPQQLRCMRRRLVARSGVDDLVVVETDDAVLVARKDRVQEVKDVVDAAQGREPQRAPRCIAKCTGRGATTTRSTSASASRSSASWSSPGAHCRCRSHTHRAEHWIVVSGTARVTRDDEVVRPAREPIDLHPDRREHRLENPGHGSCSS